MMDQDNFGFYINDGLAHVDESFSVVHRFDLPPDMAGRYAIGVSGLALRQNWIFLALHRR